MLANIAKVAVRTYSLLKVQSQLTSLCHECLIQMTHATSLKAAAASHQLSHQRQLYSILFCSAALLSLA